MTSNFSKRADGRNFDDLRPFAIKLDPMGYALSSLILQAGSTAVLCSVSLKEGVPQWLQGSGKGWLTAEYRLLPGSTPVRQEREIMKLSGRTQEIQRLISRSLRSVLDLYALNERTLLIDCDVIQADAGTRTASITGAWLALKIGCLRLLQRGVIAKDPVKEQLAAVSVGLVNGIPMLDLNYQEDSSAEVDLNVVMDSKGKLLEIQGNAEKKPFSKEELFKLLELAEKGIFKLHEDQICILQEQDPK